MGDTLPLHEEGACLGRSVTSWTSGCGLSPACWTARGWRALCAEFGISRKTGYKIFERYQDIGVRGLTDRSRRPLSPRQSAAAGGREADRAAEEGVSRAGARRRSASGCAGAGRTCTARPSAPCTPCSIATGWCAPPRRPPPAPRGHVAVAAGRRPIALWCADYKGEFLLGNRRYCYPLTITDFASRYLLACEALATTQGALCLHRLRARLSGVWAARARSAPTTACPSPRRTRSTGSASWRSGGCGSASASSGSRRAIRSRTAATSGMHLT